MFSAPSFLRIQSKLIWWGEAPDEPAREDARPTFWIGATSTLTRFANFTTRLFGARLLTITVVNSANSSLTTFASNGVRASESRIMRRIVFFHLRPCRQRRVIRQNCVDASQNRITALA